MSQFKWGAILQLLAVGIIGVSCSDQKVQPFGSKDGKSAAKKSPFTQYGKSKKALGPCPGSGTPPYVSYCGSKEGRIFIEVVNPPTTFLIGGTSLDAVGTYDILNYRFEAAGGVSIRFRAWMDTMHTQVFNRSTNPYQEVDVPTDPSTGAFTLPDFELQDPVNMHIPGNPPTVLPTDHGAVVLFDPIKDPSTGDYFVDAHGVTATPDLPSGTCISRTAEVRSGNLEAALFANLNNSCTYTFSVHGIVDGVDLPAGPSTSSVTIGAPNPGGSYAVTGGVDLVGLASSLTGSSTIYVVAFGNSNASAAIATPPVSPSTIGSYSMNLLNDDYEVVTIIDMDGDGEIDPDEYKPDEVDHLLTIGVSVAGSNLTGQDILVEDTPAVAWLATIRRGTFDSMGMVTLERYSANAYLQTLTEAVVRAQVTSASGVSPSGFTTTTDLTYHESFNPTDLRALSWRWEAIFGGSAPSWSPGDSYGLSFEVNDTGAETGAPSSDSRSATVYMQDFLDYVSGVTITPLSSPEITWTLPMVVPSGSRILVSVQPSGSCGTYGCNSQIFEDELSGSATSYTFPYTLPSGNYDLSILIRSPDGSLSAYETSFTQP